MKTHYMRIYAAHQAKDIERCRLAADAQQDAGLQCFCFSVAQRLSSGALEAAADFAGAKAGDGSSVPCSDWLGTAGHPSK